MKVSRSSRHVYLNIKQTRLSHITYKRTNKVLTQRTNVGNKTEGYSTKSALAHTCLLFPVCNILTPRHILLRGAHDSWWAQTSKTMNDQTLQCMSGFRMVIQSSGRTPLLPPWPWPPWPPQCAVWHPSAGVIFFRFASINATWRCLTPVQSHRFGVWQLNQLSSFILWGLLSW